MMKLRPREVKGLSHLAQPIRATPGRQQRFAESHTHISHIRGFVQSSQCRERLTAR